MGLSHGQRRKRSASVMQQRINSKQRFFCGSGFGEFSKSENFLINRREDQLSAGMSSTLAICKESLLPPLIRIICDSASCISSATVLGALVHAMALIQKVSG